MHIIPKDPTGLGTENTGTAWWMLLPPYAKPAL